MMWNNNSELSHNSDTVLLQCIQFEPRALRALGNRSIGCPGDAERGSLLGLRLADPPVI